MTLHNKSIATLSKAEQALANATSPKESRAIESTAAAVKAWAKEQGDFEGVVRAFRIFILARRKTTELISEHIAGAGRPKQLDNNNFVPEDKILESYGITPKQWVGRRKELEVPTTDIDNYTDKCLDEHTEPTISGLLRYSLGSGDLHISDDSYEWYTPAEILELVRRVIGDIDIDPASCEQANAMVGAKVYYTIEDDGLSQAWHGSMFMNPPYNMPHIQEFTQKAIDEYESGNVTRGVILINNATDTQWFHELLSRYPVCFTRGRVKYWGPNSAQARQGQALFYLGKNIEKFAKSFSELGIVLTKL